MNKALKNVFLSFLGMVTVVGTTQAAVLGVTDITISPTTDPINDSATLQDFTNSAGTFSLSGTTDISNATTGDSSDSFRNYWGSAASEVDGSAALEGLDLGFGAIDLDAIDFQFGALLGDGINTNGNDIVLFEIGSLDAGTTIQPLDISGSVIGDFSLTFDNGVWGDTGTDISFNLDETSSGTEGGPFPSDVSGVGLDLSDFMGTGTLTGTTGFRITSSTSLDLGAAGATVIPEPSTLMLTGLSLVAVWLMAVRRR